MTGQVWLPGTAPCEFMAARDHAFPLSLGCANDCLAVVVLTQIFLSWAESGWLILQLVRHIRSLGLQILSTCLLADARCSANQIFDYSVTHDLVVNGAERSACTG